MKRLFACWLTAASAMLHAGDFAAPLSVGPVETFGQGVQRTIRLLETSDPQNKRHIKVLAYGQSITSQSWSWSLKSFIERRFPNAHIEYANHAVSYLSYTLAKDAEAALYSFYPDIVVFHVYGPIDSYEQIVARLRARTTAEILLHNDHVHLAPELDEPVPPAPISPADTAAERNYLQIPTIADRYGAELVDIRTYWRQYIRDFNLNVADLLRDHIHFNDRGNYLFTELLTPHFRVDWNLPEPVPAVTTVALGDGLHWEDDQLQFDFVGNRVDLIFDGNSACDVHVLLDGKRPADFPELHGIGRIDAPPNSPWPLLVEIGAVKPRIPEDWALEVIEVNPSTFSVRFRVTGSVTGDDGEGSSLHDFVSNSGRVTIKAQDWGQTRYLWMNYGIDIPLGIYRWNIYPLYVERFRPTFQDTAREKVHTVISGAANGPHTLTLSGGPCTRLKAIRIYNPLAMRQPSPPPVTMSVTGVTDEFAVLWASGASRIVIEGVKQLGDPWVPLSAATYSRTHTVPLRDGYRFFRTRIID